MMQNCDRCYGITQLVSHWIGAWNVSWGLVIEPMNNLQGNYKDTVHSMIPFRTIRESKMGVYLTKKRGNSKYLEFFCGKGEQSKVFCFCTDTHKFISRRNRISKWNQRNPKYRRKRIQCVQSLPPRTAIIFSLFCEKNDNSCIILKLMQHLCLPKKNLAFIQKMIGWLY